MQTLYIFAEIAGGAADIKQYPWRMRQHIEHLRIEVLLVRRRERIFDVEAGLPDVFSLSGCGRNWRRGGWLGGKFEDFQLENEGIARGSVDTVVMADVLEHMYDPWHVMVNLKPYLAPDAQLILSIPNTRHLGLMQGLLDGGSWTYAEKGLLDITHIRFFTLKEIANFLAQTGYRMEFVNHFLDAGLAPLYEKNKSNPDINIRLGRIALEKVTPRELAELCTWQFFIRARAAVPA